jgi:hypothetical protein
MFKFKIISAGSIQSEGINRQLKKGKAGQKILLRHRRDWRFFVFLLLIMTQIDIAGGIGF